MTYTATTNAMHARMLAASIILQGYEYSAIADYLNPVGIPELPGQILRAAVACWNEHKQVTPVLLSQRTGKSLGDLQAYAKQAMGGFQQPLSLTYSVFADWQQGEVEMYAARTKYELLLSGRALIETNAIIDKFIKEHSPRIPGEGRNGNEEYEQHLQDMLNGVPVKYDCYPPLAAMRSMIGGHSPEYVIIAGRAGMGKSWMADNYALYNSLLGIPGILINLENSEAAVNKRLHKIHSGVDLKADMSHISDAEKKRLIETWEQIKSLPLIKDKCSNEIDQVCSAVTRAYYEKGIRYALIDHLHKIRAPNKRDRAQEVGEITGRLQNLQFRLGIPIIAFAQIGRESERSATKIPTIADLSWNSQLEQDARQIWLLFRPSYYGYTEIEGVVFDEEEAMLILAKCSEGKTGKTKVGWNGTRGFFDLDTQVHGYGTFPMPLTNSDAIDAAPGTSSVSSYLSGASMSRNRDEDIPF